jgi:hypothetical protein
VVSENTRPTHGNKSRSELLERGRERERANKRENNERRIPETAERAGECSRPRIEGLRLEIRA